MNTTMLTPNMNYDLKIKNKDLSYLEDNETKQIVESCKEKNICLFFCRLSEDVLTKIANICNNVSYVDTFSAQTMELAKKFEGNSKVTIFLTQMTYEQYGEHCHRIKMILEKAQRERAQN